MVAEAGRARSRTSEKRWTSEKLESGWLSCEIVGCVLWRTVEGGLHHQSVVWEFCESSKEIGNCCSEVVNGN